MKNFKQIVIAPTLVVAISAVVLFFIGQAPPHLPGYTPAPKQFDSVEQASSELGIDVKTPVYFPNYLTWPPAEIKGQIKPFTMVELAFNSSDELNIILLVYQIASDSPDLPIALPWIKTVSERIPTIIGTNPGEIIIGQRADGQIINAAHWKSGGQHFLVVTVMPVKELLAIAKSLEF